MNDTTFGLTIFANKKFFWLAIFVTRSGSKAVVTFRILVFYFRSQQIHFYIIFLSDFMTCFLHWQVWLQILKNVPLHFLAVNKMLYTRLHFLKIHIYASEEQSSKQHILNSRINNEKPIPNNLGITTTAVAVKQKSLVLQYQKLWVINISSPHKFWH